MHCDIEKPKGLTDYSTYKRKQQSLVISLQVLVRGCSDFWYTSGCIVFVATYNLRTKWEKRSLYLEKLQSIGTFSSLLYAGSQDA